MGCSPKGVKLSQHDAQPQTKEATFALFMGVVGSCWVGERRNYNQVSFVNTYENATFYITLINPKIIKE